MKTWKTISALLRLRSCWSTSGFLSRLGRLSARPVDSEQAGGCDFTQSVVDRAVGRERREDAGFGRLHFGCAGGDQLRRGNQGPRGWRLEMEDLVGGADGDRAVDQSTGNCWLDTRFGDNHFG